MCWQVYNNIKIKNGDYANISNNPAVYTKALCMSISQSKVSKQVNNGPQKYGRNAKSSGVILIECEKYEYLR